MTQGLLPPVVAADPSRSHTVFEWTVPLRYGDTAGGGRRRAHLDARRRRRGWSGRSTRRWRCSPRRPGCWPAPPGRSARCCSSAAAAALWHAGATPVPAVSVSSHTGAILAALLPALTAALVAGIGFRAARRGRGVMTGLFAVVLGLAAAGAGAAGRRRAVVGERAHQRPAGGRAGSRWRCCSRWAPASWSAGSPPSAASGRSSAARPSTRRLPAPRAVSAAARAPAQYRSVPTRRRRARRRPPHRRRARR